MRIHIVESGETLAGIAAAYGVDSAWLSAANGLPEDGALAAGQTLVVRFPLQTHTVKPGDTLTSIAAASGITLRELWRRNWPLGGREAIRPGQTLVISYRQEPPLGRAVFHGYAYPFISGALLASQLPYLTYLTPFTYGIDSEGNLLPLAAEALISAARLRGTQSVMHLSTLTEDGSFDTGRGALILTDRQRQARLIDEVLETVQVRGFAGVDVDFEYLPGSLALEYAAFLERLRSLLRTTGRFLWAALAPKISASQTGLLYEGHHYGAVGQAADAVLLMTYEWGYTYNQ